MVDGVGQFQVPERPNVTYWDEAGNLHCQGLSRVCHEFWHISFCFPPLAFILDLSRFCFHCYQIVSCILRSSASIDELKCVSQSRLGNCRSEEHTSELQ